MAGDPTLSALLGFRAIHSPLERYVYLRQLQAANPDDFRRLVALHAEEIMPFVYEPHRQRVTV